VCHDPDSGPPIPPIAGASVSHDDLVLESADGNRFAAFATGPDTPPRCGVVVLPDVRGLHHFYEEVALRLGEQGVAAVAIDYFGRTAGVAKRGEDFPVHGPRAETRSAGVQADVQRAGELRAPILALMGGADQAITADDVAAFETALAAAGVEHEVVTYDGAPHSFFDRKQEQFADVSADAWRRVLAFLDAHTPG